MTRLLAHSPIDGQVIGEFTITPPETIPPKIQSARLAANAWSALPVATRCQRLARLTQVMQENLDQLCELICQTTGKVRTEALLGEIYPTLDLIRYYEKNAAYILRYQTVATSPLTFPGATAGIRRQAYGVVSVIAPWNFPFQLAVVPMISALFAGNAVILKPSELSLPIGHVIIELFKQLDLPDGLVQWVIGEGQTGEQLIDAAPDFVFFTGGLATGRAVMQRAARHPIPVLLELGGKDAMLVFDDANLQRACDAALYGAFSHSGQICVAVERLYVQHSCYAHFLTQLIEGTAKLTLGHGAAGDLGAMTTERSIAITEAHYQDAIAKGATASAPWQRHGNYVTPILLWNVSPEMRIMREETFGPLLAVLPFTDAADAIRQTNASEFGLNASIWSKDIAKATRIAEQLQVGLWVINDVLKNAGHPALPFGGIKNSGFGRYHGAEGLRNFTYPVSGLTNRSSLPKEPNWFPYSDLRYQQFKAYLDFVYGSGSFYQRLRRNWQGLQAFRDYSCFDLTQHWHNLKRRLPWRGDI